MMRVLDSIYGWMLHMGDSLHRRGTQMSGFSKVTGISCIVTWLGLSGVHNAVAHGTA